MTLVERWKRWLAKGARPEQASLPPHSFEDDLTGLVNRRVMHETLVAALQDDVPGAVVCFDIDNFKYYNDRHGHQLGDDLLRLVAARLRETLPGAGCLARVGGDQFMAFLPERDLAAALREAQASLERLREPVVLAASAEIVTLSAGVATLDAQSARAVDAVWRACDAALHAAKARGRDRVVAFDDDTRRIVASRPDLPSTVAELQERNRALREEARTDALTGLRNRLALDELLHAVAGDGDRRVQRAAVAFIDVDHFGNFNHAHGDAAGDDALRTVARAILAVAREADLVFRKGGEEFVVVLPDADGQAAASAAERMRGAVEALGLAHPASRAAGVVTVTIGVASGPSGVTLRQLLEAAAERTMAGKVGELRNRVHAVRLPDVDGPVEAPQPR
jgi:diguanylate cyclase (GGDEF)-like protein